MVRRFNNSRREGEVAIPDDAPNTRGASLTHLSDHAQNLMRGGRRASRGPGSQGARIKGDDAKDKSAGVGCSRDDDV